MPEDFRKDMEDILRMTNLFDRRNKFKKLRDDFLKLKTADAKASFDGIYNGIVLLCRDKMEGIRSLSIEILQHGIIAVFSANTGDVWEKTAEVLAMIDSQIKDEESEVVRRQLIDLIHAIIQEYLKEGRTQQILRNHVDAISTILVYSLGRHANWDDESRKRCCECIIMLGALGDSYVDNWIELTKVLMKGPCASKKRLVKELGLRAVGEISIHCHKDGKYDEIREYHLDLPKFMKNEEEKPNVKLACAKVAFSLLKSTNFYSVEHILLRVLIHGVADDFKEVRDEAQKMMDELGKMYCDAHSDHLKDKIQDASPEDRNLIGIREWIRTRYSDMLDGILTDLKNPIGECQQVPVANMLRKAIEYAQSSIIASSKKLIDAFVDRIAHANPTVVKAVVACAVETGKYVPLDTYARYYIDSWSSDRAVEHLRAMMKTVAALFVGTMGKPLSLFQLDDKNQTALKRLLQKIIQKSIVKTNDADILLHVVFLIDRITGINFNFSDEKIEIVKEGWKECIELIYFLIMSLWNKKSMLSIARADIRIGITDKSDLDLDLETILKKLPASLSQIGSRLVYLLSEPDSSTMPLVLRELHLKAPKYWQSSSTELAVFTAVFETSLVLGLKFDVLIPYIINVVSQRAAEAGEDVDLTRCPVHYQLLLMIKTVFCSSSSVSIFNNVEILRNTQSKQFYDQIILPALKWKPGKAASNARSVACAILASMLEKEYIVDQPIDLVPLKTCFDSNEEDSIRSNAVKILKLIMTKDTDNANANRTAVCSDGEYLESALGRLNDRDDGIRSEVAGIIPPLLLMAKDRDEDKDKSVIAALVLHMDDDSELVQEATKNALIKLCENDKLKETILTEVDKAVEIHIHSDVCKDLQTTIRT